MGGARAPMVTTACSQDCQSEANWYFKPLLLSKTVEFLCRTLRRNSTHLIKCSNLCANEIGRNWPSKAPQRHENQISAKTPSGACPGGALRQLGLTLGCSGGVNPTM